MRLSEIEKEVDIYTIHQQWKKTNNVDGAIASQILQLALKNQQSGQKPPEAHSNAAWAANRAYDKQQDQRSKQGDPTDLPGTTMGSRGRDAELLRKRGAQIGNQNAVGGQVKTGADGRQLRHDRWHGDGKNAIQQMKQKWKQFQKTSGTFGKDVAKGSFIAKGAEKIGKGIVAMGDRARAAAKGRFN
jgi:hypothetical protein